jgi:hypothetical protein
MNAEQLKKFCGTEERTCEIRQPFSRGDHTYATNGHVMVRVPRLADVPEVERAPHAEKVFDTAERGALAPLPVRDLPPPETEECEECSEGEPIHDCPDCTCSCEACDDKREIPVQVSCTVNGRLFDTKYVRELQELPGIQFMVSPPEGPTWFTFEGGEGLLMPMNRKGDKHLEDDGSVTDPNQD